MRITPLMVVAGLALGSAGAASAATLDFSTQNTVTVAANPLTSGDDAGRVVLDLVGLEGRADPANSDFVTLDFSVVVDPGDTSPVLVGFWEQVRLELFDNPDPLPISTIFANATESGGLYTATAQTQVIDIEPGLGFQAKLNMYNASFGGVGAAGGAIFTISVTASDLLPLPGEGNGDGTVPPVPLPAAAWMLLAAVGSLGALSWRSRATT